MPKKEVLKRKLGKIYFPKSMEEMLKKAVEDLDFPDRADLIEYFNKIEAKFHKLPVAYIENVVKNNRQIYRVRDAEAQTLLEEAELANGDRVSFIEKKEGDKLWAYEIKLVLKKK